MKLQGKDYLYASLGIAVLWIVYRGDRVVTAVAEGAKKFVDGLAFDPATLGPSIDLTDSAKSGTDEYLKLGYLERLPDGTTRLTDKGRQYIESQKNGDYSDVVY